MKTYAVPFTKTVVEVAVDVFEIVPAAQKPIEIVGLFMGQSSDFGDAASEILPYKVIRGHLTAGTGGTAWTKRALDPTDAEASFTAATCRTVAAKEGTEELLIADSFNVMVGEKLWLPDDSTWKCNLSQNRIVVRLATAPADALTISGTIYVREY